MVTYAHRSARRISRSHARDTTRAVSRKATGLRGPCYSACTLLTAYVGRDKLCIAKGAFFAFHAARGRLSKTILMDETSAMYRDQPPEIQNWIDRNGGWQKLPLDGYWTMYDRELWAMGYPRCK